jgi:hypothetical protein
MMRGLRSARARKILAALAVVMLVVALVIPAVVYARAGGGHVGGGSSSGGSKSSGSSSSGSSKSSGGYTAGSGISGNSGTPWSGCCGTIVIIVVIFAIVVYVVIKGKSGGGGGAGGMPSDDSPAIPPAPQGDLFAEIKAGDPNFNEEMFFGRVNEMFVAIQYAWMARNLEPVRRFLADQQFTVLNNSVQTDYVQKGQINKLDNVHITQMWPVEVTKMGEYDSVKMLIEAACIDYTVDERTGEIVNPSELGDGKTPTTFQEYWTFMRKGGVQSKMDASIQKCPNCGGPVTDGNYVKCSYCGVQLNDPTLDWVLMRIEQV